MKQGSILSSSQVIILTITKEIYVFFMVRMTSLLWKHFVKSLEVGRFLCRVVSWLFHSPGACNSGHLKSGEFPRVGAQHVPQQGCLMAPFFLLVGLSICRREAPMLDEKHVWKVSNLYFLFEGQQENCLCLHCPKSCCAVILRLILIWAGSITTELCIEVPALTWLWQYHF